MKKRVQQVRSEATKGDIMQDAKKTQEMFTQSSGKVVETMTVWSDANQRVVRELAELSATAAKEGVRLYAELQQSGIEALREAQATALRWQSGWQETPRDPFAWYQRALAEGVVPSMAPHPARVDQSRKIRSMSRWLDTIPSKDERMDFCTKSCQDSPCLMSWWRNAEGRLARRVRSFSRMIWVSVTEVRSSPEAASTTEISRPPRIISSISSRVTYRLSCVS